MKAARGQGTVLDFATFKNFHHWYFGFCFWQSSGQANFSNHIPEAIEKTGGRKGTIAEAIFWHRAH